MHWQSDAFSNFEYHMFYVLCPFVTYLVILPRRQFHSKGYKKHTPTVAAAYSLVVLKKYSMASKF
jgi:hypothetical protein